MRRRPRIIPTLLIDKGNLVKTKQFKKPNYLGDPINAIRIFNEKGVDELSILDISVSKDKGVINYDLLQRMATEAFMPLSYGGGISSMDEIKHILALGFEKVIINSQFYQNPELIKQASEYIGSQSIVVSIDYKKRFLGKGCYSNDGTIRQRKSPSEIAKEAQNFGAGEILLYSIDNDGMRCGFDIDTIREVSENVDIPIVACGGANDIHSIKQALSLGKADAVAAGSMFVYYGKRDAVLINFPSEGDFFKEGIYENE